MSVVSPVRCKLIIAAVHIGRQRALGAVNPVSAERERDLIRRQRHRLGAPHRNDLLHLRGILSAEPQVLHVIE